MRKHVQYTKIVKNISVKKRIFLSGQNITDIQID